MIIFDFYYKRSNFQKREFDLFLFQKFFKIFENVSKMEENGENGRLYRVNCLYLTFIDFDFL